MTAIFWPFPINWANGLSETHEYRTEILSSRSGKEQRRSLRTTPRRRLEFSIQVTGTRLHKFNALMASSQNREITMPDWVAFTTTTTSLSAGGVTATVQSVPAWLTVGTQVLLFAPGALDSCVVHSISGNNITFTAASSAWPVGSRLYRALKGLVARELTATLPTNAVQTVPVSFEVTPASLALAASPAATASLGGWEIFERSPNWGSAVQTVFTSPLQTVDYGRGKITHFRPVPFNTKARRATYLGLSALDVSALVGAFHRAKGRRGELYVAEAVELGKLRNTWAANSTTMRVVGTDVPNDTVHRAVAIYTTAGQVYYRTVTSINSFTDGMGADTIVNLTSGIPVTVTPADIRRISWLPRHRFGSDDLTINWLTDQVAEVSLSFVTLENRDGV